MKKILYILISFSALNMLAQEENNIIQRKNFFRLSIRSLPMGIPPAILKGEIVHVYSNNINFSIGGYYAVMDFLKIIFADKNNIHPDVPAVYYAPYYPFIDIPFVTPTNHWWFQPPFELYSLFISSEYKIKNKINIALRKNKYKPISVFIGGGIGLINGKMAGKFMFVRYPGTFEFNSWIAYYSPVFFTDISLNTHIRFDFAKRKHFSFSLYYSYFPTFSEYKRVFAGWLLEFNFWKYKKIPVS